MNRLLEDILPRAACLPERVEATWLEPAEHGPQQALIAQDRWERWVKQATNGDVRAFEGLLADRGIDADKARAALGPMKLRAGVPIPPWALVLDSLLCSAASSPTPEDLALARSITAGGSIPLTDGQSLPVREGFAARLLAAFLPWARQALNPDLAASRELEDALLSHLLREILFYSLPCLRGIGDRALASECPPVEGWTAILRDSPALARVLAVAARDWQHFASELLERLAANGPVLAGLLGEATRSDPVTPVGCGAIVGDRHDQGRRVVAIDFSNGARVYYKPKDLRLGDALAGLVDLLDVDLVLPRRLHLPGYVFERAVDERRPSSPAEWERLARELGMWICLFEVLGATDLLKTNVVIAAEHLVPVDTESIVPFLFVPADRVPRLPAGIHSGLLTAPLLMRAEESVENGGLLADRANASLLDHLGAMVEGYAFMQRRLVERRDTVLRELQSWAPLPARAVVRNSWVYFRLLMESLRPRAMGDGVERDLVLERLWPAHMRSELPVKLVEAEVASLRDLDIPLFRFFVGGRDVIGAAGHVAEGALHDPPLSLVAERLEAVASEPEPADLDGLRTLAFCAAPERRADDENLGSKPAIRPRFTDLDWGEQATRVGTQLLDHLRYEGPDGQRLSTALSYVAHNNAFALGQLRAPNAQSVIGGVALVLAQVGDLALSRESKSGTRGETVSLVGEFRAEVAALREHLLKASQRSLDDVERWLEYGVDPPLCDLYSGLPALLYALCALGEETVGTATQDPFARTIDLLARFDPTQAWPRGKLLPAAGLLLALEALAEQRERLSAPEDRTLAEIRRRLFVYLVEHWERAGPTSRISPVLREVLPSPRAAASLALWRYSSNVGIALPDPVAGWMLDSRPDAGGDRFALVAMGGHSQRPELRDTSLGCLNLLEHCVVEYRRRRDPAALRTAALCGERLIARREQFQRWFPEGFAADRYRISALWGVAAIARGFCALAAPDDAWSLRLLELPKSATDQR